MKRFDKYEKLGAYHWEWYDTNKFNYRDHVDKVLRYFNGCTGSILDMGCGDGLIAAKLCAMGLTVTGVDLNERAIELGRGKCKEYMDAGRMNLQVLSIFKLNKSRKFDYVLCNEVIEHIIEPERCVKRIHVLMNKFSVITTPNSKHHTIGEYDFNMWNPDTIVNELFKGHENNMQFLMRGSDLHIKFIKE
jgi:2-polyprenyl-3-methyl-5-hydroxy-6-metoxy-1,4-benzoquinol methylase